MDTSGSLIWSHNRHLVATLGLEDVIVVTTADATLVAKREYVSQDVKRIVDQLKTAVRSEHELHRVVRRPRESYDSLEASDRFQVKRIVVKPRRIPQPTDALSRAEHWINVSGVAEVTCDGRVFLLSENESTYIPLSSRASSSHPGKVPRGTYRGPIGGKLPRRRRHRALRRCLRTLPGVSGKPEFMPCLRQRADELASALAFASALNAATKAAAWTHISRIAASRGYRRREAPETASRASRRANFERLAKHLHRYRPPSSGTLSMLESRMRAWLVSRSQCRILHIARHRAGISQSLRKPPPGACQFAEGYFRMPSMQARRSTSSFSTMSSNICLISTACPPPPPPPPPSPPPPSPLFFFFASCRRSS